MEFEHIPVLLEQTIAVLDIKEDGIYVDGTLGGGGHSEQIVKRLKSGRLIGIDRDPDALKAAGDRLSRYSGVSIVKGNFADMRKILDTLEIDTVDGILLDIGVSSHQLDDASRGFSYHSDAPLDMRMSQSGLTAADLVNTLPADRLMKIFYDYGEEKFSRRITEAIVKEREASPITTTAQLAEIISDSVPAVAKRGGHPARQCFQALRIAVNGELDALSQGLEGAKQCLKTGGILAVITFHSLEDRIVKRCFNEWAKGCDCPPDFPVCVCGKKPFAKVIIKNPVTAGPDELEQNPRSRSAKLRAIQRIN